MNETDKNAATKPAVTSVETTPARSREATEMVRRYFRPSAEEARQGLKKPESVLPATLPR